MNITVEDENDNPPIFDRQWYDATVEENAPAETELKMEVPLHIHDADTGVNAIFSVYIKGNGSELFAVDQKTFKVQVKEGAIIDREHRDVYYLRLIARDRGKCSYRAREEYIPELIYTLDGKRGSSFFFR